jgi:CheY-like chemotaxis protein
MHFSGSDTGGANPQTPAGAVDDSAHRLQVEIPAALGDVMGVTDPMAELRPPPAYFANSCHCFEILREPCNCINSSALSAMDPYFGKVFAALDDGSITVDQSRERRGKTILVVEDAEDIRKMVCAMLTQSGYGVREAGNGREALCLLESYPDGIDLVLTDLIMPQMDGADLARHLAQIRPALPVLFMSGYCDDPVVKALERNSSGFLPKPFTAHALLEKVQSTLRVAWKGLPRAKSGSCPP